MYIHMCVCVYYVCVYIMCVYICVCVYIFIYTHTHARTHTHTNVQIELCELFFNITSIPALPFISGQCQNEYNKYTSI